MKYVVAVVVMMLSNSLLLAQQSPVLTFFQFLETQTSDTHLEERVATLSPVELQHAARMIYEATESDPIAVIKHTVESHRAFDSAYARNKSAKRFGRKIGAVKQMYLDRIDTILSKRVYALTSIPYFLKVAIKSQKTIQYKSPGSTFSAPRNTLLATVLNVYKGGNRFSPYDSLVCYFDPNWIWGAPYFQNGDTCLVALDPRLVPPDNKEWLAVVTYLDLSYGYYVIRNSILHDQYNTFGYGTEIPWKDFRDSILSQIKNIKSW